MQALKIRSATKKDKLEISRLNISEPYYEFHPTKKSRGPIPIDKPRIESIILVAREDGKLKGFVLANFMQHLIYRFGYIEELYINKDSRRKGIGSSLIKAVMKKLKDLKVGLVFIGTDKENKNAIRLYKNAGFKLYEDLWFYWDPKWK